MAEDSIRRRINAGELAVAFGVKSMRSVEAALLAKTLGFDWLFIDLEHSSLDLDLACQICMAAHGCDIVPLVRVTEGNLGMATRALDGGASGIVMPHVDTAAQAREFVQAIKYPPIGKRSVAGPAPQLSLKMVPLPEMISTLNAQTYAVVMLETQTAIDNVEEIAAVEGLDILLIGSGDLSTDLGVPGQVGHEKVEECYKKLAAACKKHDKIAAVGGVADNKIAKHYASFGCPVIHSPPDIIYLMQGAASRVTDLR